MNPVFEFDQQEYLLAVQEMAAIPANSLGTKVADVGALRSEILATLDLLTSELLNGGQVLPVFAIPDNTSTQVDKASLTKDATLELELLQYREKFDLQFCGKLIGEERGLESQGPRPTNCRRVRTLLFCESEA
ncbi:CcdB family protein [Methylomonas sp. EFPC3]|uniref:CcdB family protein n=1 Tax=Methylomonas sp. EFPC3 TaxID=3021710 RepID=UPI0024173BB3|nr:CcdB family protein [Methylomonas sp. EFPC3]WFP49405.1 CcdB family protein [Methylomonas sp. EFPC3]